MKQIIVTTHEELRELFHESIQKFKEGLEAEPQHRPLPTPFLPWTRPQPTSSYPRAPCTAIPPNPSFRISSKENGCCLERAIWIIGSISSNAEIPQHHEKVHRPEAFKPTPREPALFGLP